MAYSLPRLGAGTSERGPLNDPDDLPRRRGPLAAEGREHRHHLQTEVQIQPEQHQQQQQQRQQLRPCECVPHTPHPQLWPQRAAGPVQAGRCGLCFVWLCVVFWMEFRFLGGWPHPFLRLMSSISSRPERSALMLWSS